MIKDNSNNSVNSVRRSLLKSLLGVGSLGAVSQLTLMQQAAASVSPTFSDYKAIVCILLDGGNDSFNMLVPFGDAVGKSYKDYAEIRGTLAISNTDLGVSSLPFGTGLDSPYYDSRGVAEAYTKGVYSLTEKSIPLGVNGLMPELAQLIISEKASVIANIGNLVEPVLRSDIFDQKAKLPLFLFAHNHQKRILQTGRSDSLSNVGWAGRVADNWTGVNNGNPLGLNISYSGNMPMMIGKSTNPLVLTPGVPPEFSAMRFQHSAEDNDLRSLFKALAGQQNQSDSGNVAFAASNTDSTQNPFRHLYNQAMLKSLQVFDTLSDAWPGGGVDYVARDPYGHQLFYVPSPSDLGLNVALRGDLIKSLRDVATLVDLGARSAFVNSGYNRQIFMVTLNGFDTHGSQLTQHAPLLRELSLGLWNFQQAMEELGHANKVMTYTMSDFGRTMSNNGRGTDHGWGAHHLVMGGDGGHLMGQFNGGQMFGELPDIRLGSEDDYRDKGRIIPKLSQDQLHATLCDWFGVSEELVASIFPNVTNFRSDERLRSAYLTDMFVG